jgi:hypothetical protein
MVEPTSVALEDSCNPNSNPSLHTYRIFTILVPCLLFILVIEIVWIFITYPQSIGNAYTIVGNLKKLDPNLI